MTGYSGTPLVKKMGIKENFRLQQRQAPKDYETLLGALPEHSTWGHNNDCDFIHAFYKERALFEAEVEDMLAAVKRNGMIWISWPKKASKVETDMTENVVREVALPLGLVDVKVCAVDEIWSGLKLVIRKELR